MDIPRVNLNYFKVFMVVYETRSMTRAANSLHLTQSGVSQHIKALEEELERPLFLRIGRKLAPTPLANEIYPDIKDAFVKVSTRLNRISSAEIEPEGTVRLGMPIEFGNNVLIPKLAEIGRKYKRLTFDISLGYVSELGFKLLNGELDFAYFDETPLDRRLQFKAAATEDLLLCASREYMANRARVRYTQSYFEELDYIEYTGTEPILRRWMVHHLRRRNLRLNVRAHIMDTHGVGKFIMAGLGAGVLPDHLVSKLRSEGAELYTFDGKRVPLRNEIRLVSVRGRELSPAVRATLDELG